MNFIAKVLIIDHRNKCVCVILSPEAQSSFDFGRWLQNAERRRLHIEYRPVHRHHGIFYRRQYLTLPDLDSCNFQVKSPCVLIHMTIYYVSDTQQF